MPAKLWVEVEVTKKGDLILKSFDKDISGLNKNLKGTYDVSRKVATGFKLIAGAWSVLKIKNFIKDWMNLYEEMEKSDRLLAQAAANAGKYSSSWLRNTQEMADSLQNLTGHHRSTIQMGQRLLITFDEISNDMLPRATKAMVNYAAFTGVSMNSAAKAVGKASMGLLGDLKRVGVQVSETTFHTKGFIGILEQLEAQMSGQAETFRKTAAGQWQAWQNEVKDAKIELGRLFEAIVIDTGLLDSMTEGLDKLTKSFKKLMEEGTFDIWVRNQAYALTYLIEAFTGVSQIIYEIYKGWQMLFVGGESVWGKMMSKVSGWTISNLENALEKDPNNKALQDRLAKEYADRDVWKFFVKASDFELQRQVNELNAARSYMSQLREEIMDWRMDIEGWAGIGGRKEEVENVKRESVSVWTNIWEDFATDVTDIFKKSWVNALGNMEMNFARFGQQINTHMAQAAIQNLWGVNIGKSNVTYGHLLGALGTAYGAYQGGDPLAGGISGALSGGFLTGGPVGAIFGGILGGGLGLLGGGKREPSINLLWEVIDGEIQLIAEEWKNTPRSQEVINAAREALQAQIDFYEQIAFMASGRGLEFLMPTRFTTAGIPVDPMEKLGYLIANIETFIDLFPEFADKLKFLEEYYYYTAGGGEYGFIQGLHGLVDEFYDYAIPKFEEIGEFLTDTIGNALLRSLETGDYETFKDEVKQGLYQSMLEGFTESFVQRYVMDKFSVGFDVISLNDLLQQYGTPGGPSEGEAIQAIRKIFGNLDQTLEDMHPIWEEINKGLRGMRIALDINTEALYSNIDELKNYIMTVRDTISSLKVSDLAPALSYAGLSQEYTRLLEGAGTQEGLQGFTSYIKGDYLPFMRGYATDYKQIFEKVIKDLEELEEPAEEEIVDVLEEILNELSDRGAIVDAIQNLSLPEVVVENVVAKLDDLSLARLANTITATVESVFPSGGNINLGTQTMTGIPDFQEGWSSKTFTESQLRTGYGFPHPSYYSVVIYGGQPFVFDPVAGQIIGWYTGA